MHFLHRSAATLLLALVALCASAQRPPAQPNAAEILHRMQKLNVLGSVLYIAAHPDDENTRLIAWLANGKKVRTGYLSLTRGEGGQNLIGPELGDALGIIRTQELLEARRIDGGEQFFTRAVDFGYSKSPEESFEKWGKQEVLSDVVRVIRRFRPDVIITRFPTDGGGGHGHHTASAILAQEAFDLSGDPKAFPEQLEQGLEVWQPRRLFFNGSSWWRKDVAELAKTDPDWFSVDVGGYDPLLGLSYTEIAGRSRSMHKSQGFGAAETRGEMLEYLHLEKGDKPKTKDVFEGIDMTWGRIEGGEQVQEIIDRMIAAYEPTAPDRSAPFWGELYALFRKDITLQYALRPVLTLADFLGFSMEVLASAPTIAHGDSLIARIEIVNRSGTKVEWHPGQVKQREWFPHEHSIGIHPLEHRTEQLRAAPWWPSIDLVDQPYWLEKRHGTLYEQDELRVLGRPVLPNVYSFDSMFEEPSGGVFHTSTPLTYKWVDRVTGERTRPVYLTPVASIEPERTSWLIRDMGGMIKVDIVALTDDLSGTLTCTAPKGWMISPPNHTVQGMKRGERRSFTFQHVGSNKPQPGVLEFVFAGDKGKSNRTLHEIDYPHIMPQVYYTPAEVKLIPLDVQVNAKTVGYIKGAGDEVPQAIEQLGVKVEMIDPASASLTDLMKYDAVVTGIRAYNTVAAMKTFNPTLMKYVAEGGTLVCQYNTLSRDMMVPDSLFGPYPFKLTRDRVTEEEASCTFLTADHPLMKTPNTITAKDFEGWVQERGLYFSGDLDPRYTPLLSWNDSGEDALSGGLITCDYGKGRYVYTGISFFRQLPAGVPGAYRLFANLLSRRTNGDQ